MATTQRPPNAANYDESKANPYPNLPDPLVLKNGKKVTTADSLVEQATARKSWRISIGKSTAGSPRIRRRSIGK